MEFATDVTLATPSAEPTAPLPTSEPIVPPMPGTETPPAPAAPVLDIYDQMIEIRGDNGQPYTRRRIGDLANAVAEKDGYIRQQTAELKQLREHVMMQQHRAPQRQEPSGPPPQFVQRLQFERNLEPEAAKHLAAILWDERQAVKAEMQQELRRVQQDTKVSVDVAYAHQQMTADPQWTITVPGSAASIIAKAMIHDGIDDPRAHYAEFKRLTAQHGPQAQAPPAPMGGPTGPAPLPTPTMPTAGRGSEAESGFRKWDAKFGKNYTEAAKSRIWAGLNERYGGNR